MKIKNYITFYFDLGFVGHMHFLFLVGGERGYGGEVGNVKLIETS